MRRVVALALGVLPLLAVPARAQQLTYTTHVEMRKVEAPPAVDPQMSAASAVLATALSGNIGDISGGPVDVTVSLNPQELRVRASKAMGSLSEGTTQVIHANQSVLFVNNASKTFWRFPEPPAAVLAAREDWFANQNPSMSIKRTGEFSQIAGLRAEHVTFTFTFKPAGIPPAPELVNVTLTGEAWVTSQYQSYAVLQTRTYPTALGMRLLRLLDDEGFVLRAIVRGDILGGYEIERTVTTIAEEPASTLEAPADYAEVHVNDGRSGITMPTKIKEVPPRYTAGAMRAKIQGSVTLECVVTTAGTVGDVRVLKSLDAQYGLDQEAINAVRQWQFTPGMLGGVPINVMVTVQIAFTLRDGPRPPAAAPPVAP
jgi:TonB family protein